MKKLFTIFLTFVFVLSSLCANAALPAFLSEDYNNFSAEYQFSFKFENCDELIQLLEELEMPEEIHNFVDLKALIETLLESSSTMNLQYNISDDFRKGEYSLTSESKQTVTVNKNLAVTVDAKNGIWMKYDLDAEKPLYQIIYSTPATNKYVVIDLFDMFETEEEKAQMLAYLNAVMNKEYTASLKAAFLEILEKYAKVDFSGTKCRITIDNDALIAIVEEYIPALIQKISDIVASSGIEDFPADDILAAWENMPSLEGLQILGTDGITIDYSLTSGKISAVASDADIAVDISKISTEICDTEWEYESKGILDFEFCADSKLSKIGDTVVVLPELTQENSVNLKELYPQYDNYYSDYDSEPEYPYYFASTNASQLPIIDGEMYVPFRALIHSAYDDTVTVEYDKGVLIAKCEYFPGFDKLTLTVNSGNVYTSGTLHKMPKVLLIDDYVYVSASLFTDIFGWEITGATHYLLRDEYSVSFVTR